MTQRLWSASISRSSKYTPSSCMASTIASTLDLSRPSEKFGTHSTMLCIRVKNSWREKRVQGNQWAVKPVEQVPDFVTVPQRLLRLGAFPGAFALNQSDRQ